MRVTDAYMIMAYTAFKIISETERKHTHTHTQIHTGINEDNEL